jgi:hypothetical protein
MEHAPGKSSEEQCVGTRLIRQWMDVGRTKSYKIVKELEDTCPGAVIRFGRCLRVRKNVSFRWVDEHSVQLGGARDRA